MNYKIVFLDINSTYIKLKTIYIEQANLDAINELVNRRNSLCGYWTTIKSNEDYSRTHKV